MLSDNIKEGFAKRAQAAGMTPEAAANLYKQAGPISAALANAVLGGIKPIAKTTKVVGSLGAGALAAGYAGGLAESIVRTPGQQVEGQPFKFAVPTTAGSAAAVPVGLAMDVTGISPLLSKTVTTIADGLFGSEKIQKALATVADAARTGKEISESPILADTVATTRNMSGTAQKLLSNNPADIASAEKGVRAAAANTAQGFFEGAGKSMLNNPYAIPGVIAGGTLPLVVYDLLTKKKREERAQLDSALLTHLQNQAKLKKKGSIKTAIDLKSIFRAITDPTKYRGVKEFINHTPPNVPLSSINGAKSNIVTKGVEFSPGDLQAAIDNVPKGQSLLNNSFSRNKVKGIAISGLGYMGAAGTMGAYHDYNPNDASLLNTADDFARGSWQGALAPLKALELRAFDNGEYSKITLPENIKKPLKQISDDFKAMKDNGGKIISATGQDPVYVAAQEAKDSTKKNTGVDWKTYAGVAAGIGVPYAVYKLYQMLHEKKLNKLDKQNKELKEQVL